MGKLVTIASYSPRLLPTLYELYSSYPQPGGVTVREVNPFDADLSKCTVYATLETGTLKDVTDDYPLRKIRELLKCQTCSSRKVTVTFLSPQQKRGNLHYLFEKPPT